MHSSSTNCTILLSPIQQLTSACSFLGYHLPWAVLSADYCACLNSLDSNENWFQCRLHSPVPASRVTVHNSLLSLHSLSTTLHTMPTSLSLLPTLWHNVLLWQSLPMNKCSYPLTCHTHIYGLKLIVQCGAQSDIPAQCTVCVHTICDFTVVEISDFRRISGFSYKWLMAFSSISITITHPRSCHLLPGSLVVIFSLCGPVT